MIGRLRLVILAGLLAAGPLAWGQEASSGYPEPSGGYDGVSGGWFSPWTTAAAHWGPGFPAQEGTFTPRQVERLPGVEPPVAPVLDQAGPPPADAAAEVPAAGADAAGDVSADGASGEAEVVEPEPEPPPEIWDGNFELGLDGSEGNSQRLNFRCGVEAKRKTDHDVLKLDLDYHKNTSHSEETAHRAYLDWRYEWLFQESPWTWFGHGTADYDEFKAFDVRVSIDAGLGYQFLDTEKTSLLGRCGGGWSREVGSPDDEYVPEATFGSELEHAFSKRQKLKASIEYTPDVSDFRDFRVNTKAGWQFLLDEEMNLSLKFSVLDRYDSTPHDAKANDVDYSVTLLWSF